ncbi:MAG TPA: C45 family peptidase [Polyangiaceae bacterium]|nr:C45 family peptidase [Polyangiaceae bacterium]
MSLLKLPIVECAGAARALGNQQGEQLRERIAAFIDQRLTAFAEYSRERGGPSVEQFLAAGGACLRAFETWHPEGAAENAGIAEAAGVSPEALYGATNMTDVRDVLLLPASKTDEGCTSLLVPAALSQSAQVIVGQTWDLNPTDLDFVVAVHRRPTTGPETWSVTCAGALSLTGLSALGVAVGTTNIKTKRSRVGVGYLSLLHRALQAGSAAEARELVRSAPRAAAHTYWLADALGATELECDPDTVVERRAQGQQPLARTNHCLSDSMRGAEGEAPTASSQKRLARAEQQLRGGAQNVASLQALMRDRSDGVDSINRYTEDNQGTTTNACVIAVPARRELWACRGPADRGEWVQLKFS